MFNVGDKVRALQNAPYCITTDGWTGYVVATSETEKSTFSACDIAVSSNRSQKFWVESKYGKAYLKIKIKINKQIGIIMIMILKSGGEIKNAKTILVIKRKITFKNNLIK